jgi:hypothetical protein
MVFVALVQALAWPVVLLAALCFFRAEIKAIFPRVRQLGWSGLTVDSAPAQTSVIAGAANAPSIDTYFTPFVPSDVLKMAADSIRATLPKDVPDPTEFYLHASAALYVQLNHERCYRFIFGSQIVLLKRVNEIANFPVAGAITIYDDARRLYEEVYATWAITFESWLNFPLNAGLINRNGDLLNVTPQGKNLLRYMVDYRMAENKPY